MPPLTRLHLTSGGLLLLLAGTTLASEPDPTKPVPTLDPVVVTAQAPSGAENSGSNPVAGTLLDRQQLDTFEVKGTADLSSLAPNLVTHDGGTRGNNSISGMRGMMNSLSFTDPSVVYYVDDVPASTAILSYLDPYSLQTIGVLAGPQSGFFGQNAPGGVVRITQSQPQPVFSSTLTTEYGNYDRRGVFGEFTEGIKGTDLSVLASGHYTSQQGFLTNPVLNTHPDGREEFSGRVALRWTPTKQWTFDLNITQTDDNDGVQRYTPLGSPHQIAPNLVDGKTDLQRGVQSLRTRYDGDDVTVTFISSHVSADLDPNVVDTGFGTSSAVSTNRTHEQQYTQELRVASKDDVVDGKHRDPFSWLAGLETQHIDYAATLDTLNSGTTVATNTLLHADYDSYAAFGAFTIRPDDKSSLTFSNRLQADDKGGDRLDNAFFGGALQSATAERERRCWLNFAPKVEGDYEVAKETTLYSSTGLAFRPGGYSPYPVEATLKPYASERTWANEVGVRYEAWEHRFKTRATLFWNEVYGYQLERYNGQNSTVENAPEVASRGAEYDVELIPVDGLTLHGSAGYTYATFVNYTDSVSGKDVSGLNVPYVPRATFLLEGTYRHPTGWMVHSDLRGLGATDYNVQNIQLYRQNAYGLVGAKIGYESTRWSAYVYGENLANAQYSVLVDTGLGAQISGDPRTYGIAANLRW